MSKGVTFRPIFTAYKSATLLGFSNTALMIEGLMEKAKGLDFAHPAAERKKISDEVVTKIGCIRSAMEKERSDHEKKPGEWFGWTRMNVLLGETLKGIGVAGIVTYAACSAAGMFHVMDAPGFSWTMFFVNAGVGLARAIWLTAGSSREKLIRRINGSLTELEKLAKECE